MKTKIVVPTLTHKNSQAVSDTGGAATVGARARKAISEQIANITIESDSLDRVVEAAVGIFNQAVSSASKLKEIKVDEISIHIGITAGGSVGILGTGVDVEAEASFEITFKAV